MNEPAIDIERVVREVLAELTAARAEVAQEAKGDEKRADRGLGTSVPSTPAAELTVRSHVVTMLELSGRLDAVRRVIVPQKAIVTPAVRDELLRRGIALEYADASNGRRPPAVRLAIVTMGTDFDPGGLIAGLTREGWKTEHAALNCLIAATDQLAAEVSKPDTLGVLLTRHTAAALCLANRLGGVRAVAGCDAPAVATAAAAVGANLLVADPEAGTFFQLKQMVTEFCRGGVRPCPAVFRARLT